jgi:hypothetical protein
LIRRHQSDSGSNISAILYPTIFLSACFRLSWQGLVNGMKPLRPTRCASVIPSHSHPLRFSPFLLRIHRTRHNSTTASAAKELQNLSLEPAARDTKDTQVVQPVPTLRVQSFVDPKLPAYRIALERFPSPPTEQALRSAKLAALHARLTLPSSFSIHTLARCLVDTTADPNPWKCYS